MRPLGFAYERRGGAGTPSTFVGSIYNPAALAVAGQLPIPGSSLAGDFAIAACTSNVLTPTTATGATSLVNGQVGGANNFRIIYKVLSSTDISNGYLGGATNTDDYFMTVYRGPTTASVASSYNNSITAFPLSIPGFTKSVSQKGTVTFYLVQAANGPPNYPSSPFTGRISQVFFSAQDDRGAADALSTPYVDGTAITWPSTSPGTAGNQRAALYAIELLP